MKTAVQLRRPSGPDRPRTKILHGHHCAILSGKLGPVALFDPGELVAYELRYRRHTRVFVFRTLEVDDRLAAWVPGVRPRVQLLFQMHTPKRIERVRGLFAYLARTGRDPSTLAEDFYVRVGAVLAGRLPSHKILLSLLPQPPAPAKPCT
jgi:hypothetical protein